MIKTGAYLSILAGMLFAISGIAFFSSQVGRFDWNSIRSISEYVLSQPNALALWKLVNGGAALAAFLAIGGVLALSERVKPAHEGFVRWTSTLAIIGYTILAVSNIADLYQIERLAAGYPTAGAAAQVALEIGGIGSLDPTLSLRFITIGVWILVAGWFSVSSRLLPRALAYFGVVAGVFSLMVAVASFFGLQSLTLFSGAAAVVCHPIWLVWTGVALRRSQA